MAKNNSNTIYKFYFWQIMNVEIVLGVHLMKLYGFQKFEVNWITNP